jgi:broad specificity polyphosphatase/5'/3'-nucleotidase SurE
MRILITNDDGIHAEGLAVLERIAAPCPTMSGSWRPKPIRAAWRIR